VLYVLDCVKVCDVVDEVGVVIGICLSYFEDDLFVECEGFIGFD